jgi:hypothetical protein
VSTLVPPKDSMTDMDRSRKRVDDRDRRNRIEVRTHHWDHQIKQLTDAYLVFNLNGAGVEEATSEASEVAVGDTVMEDGMAGDTFEMNVIDVFGETVLVLFSRTVAHAIYRKKTVSLSAQALRCVHHCHADAIWLHHVSS